jgi:hypothetical protein
MILHTAATEPGKREVETPYSYSPLPGSLSSGQSQGQDQDPWYPTPCGKYPRVSSILDSTMSVKQRAALQNWKTKDKAARQEAKSKGEHYPAPANFRGSTVHRWREIFLKTGNMPTSKDLDLSQISTSEVGQYFNPLVSVIKLWDPLRHIWCEGPMNQDDSAFHKFLYVDRNGETKARLWSDEYQYAGCPDDLGFYKKINPTTGEIEWRLTLCDLKTSEKLYYSSYPEAGEQDWHLRRTGYQKFDKCCLQLGAYWLMVKEQLDLDPDLMMIVATPGRTQRFTLSPIQKRKAISGWKKRLDQYYQQLSSDSEEVL